LPYLIDEEVKLTETLAIAKYICAKWRPELLISDPVQFGLAEMLSASIMKLKEVSTVPCY
jgi:glutathione S-transferase